MSLQHDLLPSMARYGLWAWQLSGYDSPPSDCSLELISVVVFGLVRGVVGYENTLSSREEQFKTIFDLSWTQQGMPIVDLGARLAASLCASKADLDSLGVSLHAPWNSFVIALPPRLVQTEDKGQHNDVELILVTNQIIDRLNPKATAYSYCAIGHQSALWEFCMSEQRLFSEDTTLVDDSRTILPVQRFDVRSMVLCRAIVRGVILYCLDGERRQQAKQHPGTSSKARKARPDFRGREIVYDRYLLTGPVKVDLRERMRNYLHGHHASPSVRHLVRGHFKGQPCGEGRKERRVLWIEPYWRGEEGLALGTKTYKLEQTKG